MGPRINTRASIKLVTWNAHSIFNKINELEYFLHAQAIDIALLTETHATPSNRINVSNYKSYRCDRLTHRGGGVAILVKSSLQLCLIKEDRQNGHEAVTVSVPLPDYGITYFTALYNPPHRYIKEKIMEELLPLDKPTILAGDLNAKSREWGCRFSNRNGAALLKYILNHPVYFYAPTDYTFLPSNPGRGDILDIVLSTTDIPMCLEVLQDLTSDHVPVVITLGTSQILNNKMKKQTDWEIFDYLLSESEPSEINLHDTNAIEMEVHKLTNDIKDAYKNATKQVPAQQYAGLLPKFIREKIKERNRMRKRWNRTWDPRLKINLNKLNREIKTDIINYKQELWEDKILSFNNTRDGFWSFARRLKSKRTVNKPIYSNQVIALTDKDKAEVLAEHLSHQFTPHEDPCDINFVYEVRHYLQNWMIEQPAPNRIEHTNLQEIKDIVKRLRMRKAPGFDEITNLTIKYLPDCILLRYVKILNRCLDLSYFPYIWKKAKVILLPKPGKDCTRAEGFRPISLLPGLGKILERIILKRMQPYLDILPSEQFGFRAGLSTTKQLVRLTEYLGEALHIKQIVALLMLDVAKAFDRVWHEGLIYKLINFNFSRELVHLIYSFIRERTFYVSVGSDTSGHQRLGAGVPQGSILGPLLYIIYVADFPKDGITTNHYLGCYADDTAIATRSISPDYAVKKLQLLMPAIEKWCEKWRISINAAKSKLLIVRRTRTRKPITERLILFGTVVPVVKHATYLGVIINEKLTWKQHVNSVKGKAIAALTSLGDNIWWQQFEK
ncbi:putative RNA-directed DNA polymerase from transposon X-element, partial [Stegodyphus mimosarum]